MQKGGIIRCKLKGQMDQELHYDVEMKGWIDGWMDERCFRPLLCTVKAELGRGLKRWNYDVQLKRADGKGIL